MTIGEKIKNRRKELNKTLEEVGKIVGVSKQTIQRYETGEIANIPYDKIVLLAQALNCSGADFFFEESISEKYDIENARLMNLIKNDERLRDFTKKYISLPDDKQNIVRTLVDSLASDNR